MVSLSRVVVAREFQHVALQVLRAHVVVDADVAALEACPKVLHAVLVGHTPHVLAYRVLHGLVSVGEALVDLGIVRLDLSVVLGAGGNEPVHGCLVLMLHDLAITDWKIDADVEHVMAPEIRAAYVQMASVWQYLPDELRPAEFDGDWWANEARSGMLATYDHPTGMSLAYSAGWGGFGERDLRSDLQLAQWLGRLGFGYGPALVYLAKVLEVSEDIESCVSTVTSAATDGTP